MPLVREEALGEGAGLPLREEALGVPGSGTNSSPFVQRRYSEQPLEEQPDTDCDMLTPPPPQRGSTHTASKCIRIKYFWANVK